MPIAKVGAMSNDNTREKTHKEGKDGRSKASRRKGITIEDLKQQTAMRLAKQQESRQKKNSRNHHKVKASPAPSTMNPPVATESPHYVPKPGASPKYPSLIMNPSTVSVHSAEASVSTYSGYSHTSYHQGSVRPGYGSGHVHSEHATCLPNGKHVHRGGQKAPTVRKNLVHGLTVQELKEMTRARLANEATEENASVTTTPVTDDTSQYSFQRTVSHDEGMRQRLHSADSWRLRKVDSRWNPFLRAKNHTHYPPISSFYSADAADSMSVNSMASGYATESFLESETSDIYTATSSMDLGRSSSFPSGYEVTDGCINDYQRQLHSGVSFETTKSRIHDIGVPSSVLSNLVEGKPFSPDTIPSSHLSTNAYDFAGLPSSPVLQKSTSCEETFQELLQRQTVTPSTMQTYSRADEYQTSEIGHFHVPDLDMSAVNKLSMRSSDLPNSVAESVLGYSEDPLGAHVSHLEDPWEENEENELSKIEKDLNNLLLFENCTKSNDDGLQPSSLETCWAPITSSSNVSPHRPFVNVVPENFNDDDVEFVVTPERRRLGESCRNSPSKSSGRRRNTSRWNFLNL